MRASILLPEREQPDRMIGRECGRRRAKLFKMRGNPFAARMAKLADAADLKSAGAYPPWGFKSPSGHHAIPLNLECGTQVDSQVDFYRPD